MSNPLSADALNQLFVEARTYNAWADTPVSDADIHAIYDLMKWGSTSANGSPARFVWVKSAEGKQTLSALASGSNRPKILQAPVTVIIGYDVAFAEQLPRLFPQAPEAKNWFANPQHAEVTAFRNGTLQGGYLILAARALGLDCGPMSGFDNAGVDKEFFAGTTIKSNFICSIGRGDGSQLSPRAPRLSFEEAGWIA